MYGHFDGNAIISIQPVTNMQHFNNIFFFHDLHTVQCMGSHNTGHKHQTSQGQKNVPLITTAVTFSFLVSSATIHMETREKGQERAPTHNNSIAHTTRAQTPRQGTTERTERWHAFRTQPPTNNMQIMWSNTALPHRTATMKGHRHSAPQTGEPQAPQRPPQYARSHCD